MKHRDAEKLLEQVWTQARPCFTEPTSTNPASTPSGMAWESSGNQSINDLEEYFWGSATRFAILVSLLDRYLSHGARVLDAGAGHGLLAAAIQKAGFSAKACDLHQGLNIFDSLNIPYQPWNLEAEGAPYVDNHFDAVVLSQTIEHFTYSVRHPLEELIRITKPGGLMLIDAPNISCFRNTSRLLRGKSLHWDFKENYLKQEPVIVNGIPYYDRHNHEYCMQDMRDIASYFQLELVEARYYSSYNQHKHGRFSVFASQLRDMVPHWRKALYAVFRLSS